MRKGLLVCALIGGVACAASIPASSGRERNRARDEDGRTVRVALSIGVQRTAVSATGEWLIQDGGGRSTLVRAGAGETWTIERGHSGDLMRAVRSDSVPTMLRSGPFVVRAVGPDALVSVDGRRYRGEIRVAARDTGLVVVNHLLLEDYLRGVVSLEIGTMRTLAELAAVEAQAVAARSYAYTRLSRDTARLYELRASVLDQVYGGVEGETPIGDRAVSLTTGLVLTFAGRPVNAPYSSTCGGSTSAASEVWQVQRDEPYLVPVDDRMPDSNRYYCDPSPRFSWTQTFDRSSLARSLDRYLRTYAAVPQTGPGVVRRVEVAGLTPTGRVRSLIIGTDRAQYSLRANDIRFVLRSPGGEILNSTYFSVESEHDSDGTLSRLTLRGRGYGHGIGMCQWGAIGRARAGQTFRDILRTYYPGTSVETLD
ncbi:MAG: SpoIID/LytB domain-containing protein [Gemmatimonadaceae bacterium]